MTQVLTSLSDALAETVAAGDSSVVRVEARDRVPASGIVWPGQGIIVTAHHVVERDENIMVGLPDGETVTATLAGRDPTTDLAVLRTEGGGLPEPTWADPDDLRVEYREEFFEQGPNALEVISPRDAHLSDLVRVIAVGEVRPGRRLDLALDGDSQFGLCFFA